MSYARIVRCVLVWYGLVFLGILSRPDASARFAFAWAVSAALVSCAAVPWRMGGGSE